LKEQQASYQQALVNSKELERIVSGLRDRYQAISPENIDKLKLLLPDYVNNVQLIIEIEKVALTYGMILKNVKFDLPKEEMPSGSRAPLTREQAARLKKEYGIFDLTFTTEGSYSNFVNFVRDLEKSLRIIDIESINFSSAENTGTGAQAARDIYKYELKVKTYWLKNK